MDWSLCQPDANRRFLRDVRGYKPAWPYYAAMVIDPILRFNWVFYIIYTHDLQHSSIASFLIAFSEISRRGMWTLFRVENEHCANVAHFKASRDVPLPYDLSLQEADTFASEHQDHDEPLEPQSTTTQTSPQLARLRSRTSATAPKAAEEGEAGPSGLRHRALNRRMTLTQIFAEAHTQDFEKKRKPSAGDSDDVNNLSRDDSPDDGDGFHGEGRSSDEEDDYEDGAEEALHALDADEARVARRNRQGRRIDKDAGGDGDMDEE
jgi:xenotropic and polytropic retrovirus receptor 1